MVQDRDVALPGWIGPYHVEREVARGGMGVVYLARDSRLERLVAIKTLPDDFASDPERLARFEREARVVASLNHPNIAGIHGVEQSGGRRYLVLEYVEGETLAQRLQRGPLPLGEALDIGIQIASAMEAAHEGGVIHRDLKPGNVMITPGEAVKVLDFGLAKGRVASEADVELGDSPPPPDSPTLARPSRRPMATTIPGVILGTAAYLSPEQARGRAVDRRTDIWAFGCMLFECMTGASAFPGDTSTETIARILEREPEWTALPSRTPPKLLALMQHCLEKDPRHRLRDIGDARLVLEEVQADLTAAHRERVEHPVTWLRSLAARPVARRLALLLLGAALGIGAWVTIGPGRGERAGPGRFHGVGRVSVEMPRDVLVLAAGMSPDGRFLTAQGHPRAATSGPSAANRIYVRSLHRAGFEPLRGTEGALGPGTFSPDGRWIAFVAPVSPGGSQLRLLKVPSSGAAPPVEISPWDNRWQGPVWLNPEEIVVGVAGRHFVRLPVNGGPPSAPVQYQMPESTLFVTPAAPLPDGRHVFLNMFVYEEGVWRTGTGVLDTGTGVVRRLLRDGGSAAVSPTGHLLFTQGEVLLAAPFDSRKLEIAGPAVAVMDGLRTNSSWLPAVFVLGTDGTLGFGPGGALGRQRRAVLVDARGTVTEWSPERREFAYCVAVSPDGGKFATAFTNPKLLTEIWVCDRGRSASRLVAGTPGADLAEPIWSRNGRRIAYLRTARDHRDGVYVQEAVDEGRPPRAVFMHESGATLPAQPTSWSPDGSTILATVFDPGRADVFALPVSARGDSLGGSRPLLAGPANETGARFSPDGRWIAYASDETGANEVYVRPYLPGGSVGAPTQVSAGGGTQPMWSPDGRTLYYVGQPSRVMAAALALGPRVDAAPPRQLWDLAALRVPQSMLVTYMIDVAPDGRLFAIQQGDDEAALTSLELVLNFPDELRARMRAPRGG